MLPHSPTTAYGGVVKFGVFFGVFFPSTGAAHLHRACLPSSSGALRAAPKVTKSIKRGGNSLMPSQGAGLSGQGHHIGVPQAGEGCSKKCLSDWLRSKTEAGGADPPAATPVAHGRLGEGLARPGGGTSSVQGRANSSQPVAAKRRKGATRRPGMTWCAKCGPRPYRFSTRSYGRTSCQSCSLRGLGLDAGGCQTHRGRGS